MKIQTLSVVVGDQQCNASCPYCISKQTGFDKRDFEGKYNYASLTKALRLAALNQVSTVLITGKGEPTLDVYNLEHVIVNIEQTENFPFIELQTNGIALNQNKWMYKRLAGLGLTTVILTSTGDVSRDICFYGPGYPDLGEWASDVKRVGMMPRLNVVMTQGAIDSVDALIDLCRKCRDLGIPQLTARPAKVLSNCPAGMAEASKQYIPRPGIGLCIEGEMEGKYHKLMTMMHGAVAYDVMGVSLCLTDCLTRDVSGEDLRQLIVFPSGRIAYDWEYRGATLFDTSGGER